MKARSVVVATVATAAAVCLSAGLVLLPSRPGGSVQAEWLRFHVVANSDSPHDQAVKLMVRDAIWPEVMAAVGGADGVGEARRRLQAQLPRIEASARSALLRAGETADVRVEWGAFAFPAQSAGGRVYPPGTYQALRVVIGRGQGHNWWCVVFPPLCNIERAEAPAADGEAVAGNPLARHAFSLKPEPALVATGAPAGAWAGAPAGDHQPLQVRLAALEVWDRLRRGTARAVDLLGLSP